MIISAFGVIHKSQLSNGAYVPITQLTPKKRKEHKQSLVDSRSSGMRQKMFRYRIRTGPEYQGMQLNDAVFRVQRNDPSNSTVRNFTAGAKKRLGYTPKVQRVNSDPGLAGSVNPSLQGVHMVSNPQSSGKGRKAFQTGIHESAHYATDRDVRRGKTRNPWRLAQISASSRKTAKEEARANSTAARYLGSKMSPDAYDRGDVFTPREQRSYNTVRQNMGTPNPLAQQSVKQSRLKTAARAAERARRIAAMNPFN